MASHLEECKDACDVAEATRTLARTSNESTEIQHHNCFIATMPTELMENIFDQAMGLIEDLWNSQHIVDEHAYIAKSLILSHVSQRWRYITFKMAHLWPIFYGLCPDAVEAFVQRASRLGIRVRFEEPGPPEPVSLFPIINPYTHLYCAPVSFFRFIESLETHFKDIKTLVAKIRSRRTLQMLLAFGHYQSATMEKLAYLDIQYSPHSSYEEGYPPDKCEDTYGVNVLLWSMPVASCIQLQNILHSPICATSRHARISLSFNQLTPPQPIHLSPADFQKFLSPVTTLRIKLHRVTRMEGLTDLILSRTGQIFQDPIVLPALEELSTELIAEEPVGSFRSVTTFNTMRFPVLQGLFVKLCSDLPINLYTRLHDVFRSMRSLRRIGLDCLFLDTKIDLSEFLDPEVFPYLEHFEIAYAAITSAMWCAHRRGLTFQLFPQHLRKIEFLHCFRDDFIRVVLPQLLDALDRQFDTDLEHGRVVASLGIRGDDSIERDLRKVLGDGIALRRFDLLLDGKC